MIINIISIVLIIILLIFMLINENNKAFIVSIFSTSNTITFGTKGKGKDLLFQMVINQRRKPYYATYSYGGKYEKIEIATLSVAPNTYEKLINGEIQKIDTIFPYRKDVYLGDLGLFLPSQYNNILDKKYPSLPITYATSRHLGEFNIHANAQAIGRIWLKLREQADAYFKALGVIRLPFGFLLCYVRYYELYQTAEQGIKPYHKIAFNKEAQAEKEKHLAQYGEIRQMWYIIHKSKIKYNTRYFATVFYDINTQYIQGVSPKKKKERKKAGEKH